MIAGAASTWQTTLSGIAAGTVVLAFVGAIIVGSYKASIRWHEILENSRETKAATVEVKEAVVANGHGKSMADDVAALRDEVGTIRQMQETGAAVIGHLVQQVDGFGARLQGVETTVGEMRQEQAVIVEAVTAPTTGEVPITPANA